MAVDTTFPRLAPSDPREGPGRPQGHLLLTHFGTFVCYDEAAGVVCHRPHAEIGREPELSFVRVGLGVDLVEDQHACPAIAGDGRFEERWTARRARKELLFHLSRQDAFLCAEPNGQLTSRDAPGAWETFRIFQDDELVHLGRLADDRWLATRSGEVVRPLRLAFGHSFTLLFGDYKLDVSGRLLEPSGPRARDGNPDEFIGYYDAWKVAKFRRFEPLVYYASFGADRSFEMMSVSLQSLHELGTYDGDVLVISDRPKERIQPYIPTRLRDRFHVLNVDATDFIGYCRARYQVPSWPEASRFQPLLYVDTDVLFDLPVWPVLASVALSPAISAQREATRPLATSDSVGSMLLAEDGSFVGDKRGFNSGILGIPDIRRFGAALTCIAEVIDRFAAARGKQALGWFDQAVANYVLHKVDDVDFAPFDRTVRWGGRTALHGGTNPLGLVHLWGADDKLAEMRDLLDLYAGRIHDVRVRWTIYD